MEFRANVSTIDERIKSIYHSIVTSKCTRSQEEKFVDGIELSNKLTEGGNGEDGIELSNKLRRVGKRRK